MGSAARATAGKVFQRWVVLRGVTHHGAPSRSRRSTTPGGSSRRRGVM